MHVVSLSVAYGLFLFCLFVTVKDIVFEKGLWGKEFLGVPPMLYLVCWDEQYNPKNRSDQSMLTPYLYH